MDIDCSILRICRHIIQPSLSCGICCITWNSVVHIDHWKLQYKRRRWRSNISILTALTCISSTILIDCYCFPVSVMFGYCLMLPVHFSYQIQTSIKIVCFCFTICIGSFKWTIHWYTGICSFLSQKCFARPSNCIPCNVHFKYWCIQLGQCSNYLIRLIMLFSSVFVSIKCCCICCWLKSTIYNQFIKYICFHICIIDTWFCFQIYLFCISNLYIGKFNSLFRKHFIISCCFLNSFKLFINIVRKGWSICLYCWIVIADILV